MNPSPLTPLLALVSTFSLLASTSLMAALQPCRIEVVEDGSGWPVPLVEFRTLHQVRFVTDNAGVIAFDLPELMGVETWFDIHGHGYEVDKDGFGYRGVRLTPEPGATLRVTVKRRMPARRLGRLTGAGLFGESQKVGAELDWKESGVLGCDSVLNAMHKGRLFWIWGDTTLARYPLGLFHASGATTSGQPLSSLEPPLRLHYDYFRDKDGRPRNVAEMKGEGPTWLMGLISLPDAKGNPHLVASFSKIKPPMEIYESGLCEWNETSDNFEPVSVVWKQSGSSPKPPPMPHGHPIQWTDDQQRSWVLFGDPLPDLRCPATYEAWKDTNTWEVLTPPTTFAAAGGKDVIKPHRGSMVWNAFRQRWVTVFVREHGNTSYLGEIYYAEAASPRGPWGPAVRILWHDNHTFYNPRIHPGFTEQGSPLLLFEATYTRSFADRPEPTPRYDYNQVLYRLDLNDPSLIQAH